MKELEKWRREADRLLAAPIERKRSITSVVGKVDDRFDSIMAARRRGMTWAAIASALAPDGSAKEESVESAFRRLSEERGVAMPRRTTPGTVKKPVKAPTVAPAAQDDNTLFGQRWVDNGDD